ncbi:MAG: alpha-glucosidase [Actinobacteria bacterium]|nr:MAG: alpha-glucosidase [Actinomycetota bacterium]
MASEFPWWRHAVVYQVYLRSFADGNNDGTGDIAGLRDRLPYIRSLGVDAIWVNPWYESPLADGGYDVANYRRIDERFGTIEDARALIEEAKQLGLRLLVDLVPNHTSSEHRWFKEAITSPPGSPARDRYHILPGKGPDGAVPPTDWRSVFGGSAWTRLPDGEWYLHLFDASQPDLNWANEEVQDEFKSIMRFWLDLGASGFRVDVAHALVKEQGYPDTGVDQDQVLESLTAHDSPVWDRNELHDIVRGWRKVLDEYPDTMMIAEAWVPSWDRLSRYLRPGEYHQAFDFHFLMSPWDPVEMKSRIDVAITSAAKVGAVPTWVLSNHDVVRHATRYGLPNEVESRSWLLDGDRSLLDPDMGLRRSRAAALLMLALPGSVYLYQGEELGLPEVHDLPAEVLQDPVWERSGNRAKGRDGCRVPIPWTEGDPAFGFCGVEPWLPQPEWWGEYSVEAQDGRPGSTLELYRSALELRDRWLRSDEDIEWLDFGQDVVAFRRGSGLTCVVNFGDPIHIPDGDLLAVSEPLDDDSIPTDAAVWLASGD